MGSSLTQLTFGMVSPLDEERLRVALNEFCAELGESVGLKVLRHRSTSPAALASAFAKGQVQLAWLSPALFVLSQQLSEAVPLVSSVRQGASFYHSVLFVLKQSPIRSYQQLKGSRVAWVAASSAAGYIFPRLALGKYGLDVQRLFQSEVFCESHTGVTRAVVQGRADVGATYAVFEGANPMRPLVRAGFLELEEAPEFRIIERAGPIPSDLFVAHPSLPAPLLSKLSSALKRFKERESPGAYLKTLFGTYEFGPFANASLSQLNEMILTGRESGLLQYAPK